MLGAIEKLYTFVNCNRLITKVMKKLFPLICFLFSLIPFVKGQSVTDSIVVSGKVVLRTPQSPKVITAIECNPWQDSGRKAVWLAEDGSFKTKMYFPYLHDLHPLFLAPLVLAIAFNELSTVKELASYSARFLISNLLSCLNFILNVCAALSVLVMLSHVFIFRSLFCIFF